MFTPIAPNEKLSNKILQQITRQIREGSLQPGDKLPPEREMAEMMGVSRPALKQAISALEAMGIIESRQGGGNYIQPWHNKIFNPITLSFFTSNGTMDNVLEVRCILEIQAVKLSTMKCTEADLQELANILERMKTFQTTEERVRLNEEFHISIIRISKNPLLLSLYESLLGLISEQISQTDGTNFYESHRLIYDAICSGSAETAALRMLEHFSNKFPNYQYYKQIL